MAPIYYILYFAVIPRNNFLPHIALDKQTRVNSMVNSSDRELIPSRCSPCVRGGSCLGSSSLVFDGFVGTLSETNIARLCPEVCWPHHLKRKQRIVIVTIHFQGRDIRFDESLILAMSGVVLNTNSKTRLAQRRVLLTGKAHKYAVS